MACSVYGSDVTGGETFSASNGTGPEWAFDDNTGSGWYNNSPSFDCWLQVQFASAKQIEKLRIYIVDISYGPTSFHIYGSNTGAFSGEETEILDWTGSSWASFTWNDWEFENAATFTYYRIVFHSYAGGSYFEIRECEMLECLGPQGNISEGISVSESISAVLEYTGELPPQHESIGIIENIQIEIFETWRTVSQSQNIAISESITVELEVVIEASLTETIGISEDINIAFLQNAVFNETVAITEFLNVALDIPLNWIALANQGLTKELYYFTLTGDADGTTDIEIPISSFQARKRTGESTYLSVIIDDYATYAAAIAARANGEMIVEMAYQYGGETSIRQEILRADLETINLYQGGLNRSINLVGHKTQTFINRSVTLENPTYESTVESRRTFRFAKCDPYLNPGDTLVVGADSMTIDHIIYMISDGHKSMEVKET